MKNYLQENKEMTTKIEKEVRSIGEYLGCNEDELWSEMSKVIKRAEIRGAEKYIEWGFGKRCKMTDKEDFPDEDFDDPKITRCGVCEQYEYFDEWVAKQ